MSKIETNQCYVTINVVISIHVQVCVTSAVYYTEKIESCLQYFKCLGKQKKQPMFISK